MADRQYLDRSVYTVLAVCTCGWRELASNDVAAWECNVTHAALVHGDAQRAIRSLSITRIRAERKSDDVRATA